MSYPSTEENRALYWQTFHVALKALIHKLPSSYDNFDIQAATTRAHIVARESHGFTLSDLNDA